MCSGILPRFHPHLFTQSATCKIRLQNVFLYWLIKTKIKEKAAADVVFVVSFSRSTREEKIRQYKRAAEWLGKGKENGFDEIASAAFRMFGEKPDDWLDPWESRCIMWIFAGCAVTFTHGWLSSKVRRSKVFLEVLRIQTNDYMSYVHIEVRLKSFVECVGSILESE